MFVPAWTIHSEYIDIQRRIFLVEVPEGPTGILVNHAWNVVHMWNEAMSSAQVLTMSCIGELNIMQVAIDQIC